MRVDRKRGFLPAATPGPNCRTASTQRNPRVRDRGGSRLPVRTLRCRPTDTISAPLGVRSAELRRRYCRNAAATQRLRAPRGRRPGDRAGIWEQRGRALGVGPDGGSGEMTESLSECGRAASRPPGMAGEKLQPTAPAAGPGGGGHIPRPELGVFSCGQSSP